MHRSNSENTPPSARTSAAKSKVRGGIQGASLRRRARITGGPHHPRYLAEHAKRKHTTRETPKLVNTGHSYLSPEASVGKLPRYLSRPKFYPISQDVIQAIAPELADTALQYIRDGLECLGPRMLRVLNGVKCDTSTGYLPEMPIVVHDLSSDMPTHVLAVYVHPQYASPGTQRRLTLYPIHNIMIATHCAHVPLLPNSDVARPDTPGSLITLPVVPLCLPAPDVFHVLLNFLYTKRIDILLAMLMPCPVPRPLWRDDPTSDAVLNLLQQFAGQLAKRHSVDTLLVHAKAVNGLWLNACSLGMDDTKLWCALDVAWEVLIIALGISTGRRF